jgi:TrpR-related protein YerC/YecD
MYESKLQSEELTGLFEAVLELRDLEDCYRFFEDLCTVHELHSLAQRLQVAKMLREKVIYQEIADKTGASTATISRVNRSLLYGADGYLRVLDRLDGKKK